MVKEAAIRDAVRQVLLPLWNTYCFFTLYAGAADGGRGYLAESIDLADAQVLAALDVRDRHVLAHTKRLAGAVRGNLDAFGISSTCQNVRDYIDMLTSWYVHTSRDRLWSEDERAFDTLYAVLVNVSKIVAPLLPLLAEEMYKRLTGERSVHLAGWPELPETCDDSELVAQVDEMHEIVSAGYSLRKTNKLHARPPLRTLWIVSSQDLSEFSDLVTSKVNVKKVHLESIETCGMTAARKLAVLPRRLEPEWRKLVSSLFKAAREGAWEEVDGGAVLYADPPVRLRESQYTVTTSVVADNGAITTILPSGSYVTLDVSVDDGLEAEGYTRDVVQAVQEACRAAGLHISDRIALTLSVLEPRIDAVETHIDFIAGGMLATRADVRTVSDLTIGAEGA